jgi:uncharacterized protein YhjY with autotransporter beta-barrel domain
MSFRIRHGDRSIRRGGRCARFAGTGLAAALLLLASFANAECTLADGVFSCTGDLPDGIILVIAPGDPPITTLELNGITTDVVVLDRPGVYMLNTAGGRVTVNAGALGDRFLIDGGGNSTSTNSVFGLGAGSIGAPGAYAPLPGFPLLVPVGTDGAGVGGAVEINSFADVMTSGTGSSGILAFNQVGTYPQIVIDLLNAFDPDDPSLVTYEVISVAGGAANLNTAVAGSDGGLFTIQGDGSYVYDDNGDFDSLVLQPYEESTTSVDFFLNANGEGFGNGEIRIVYFVDYNVISVAGDAANLNTAVAGSDGGIFTIRRDGRYVYDDNGDFDDLVLGPGEELRTSVGFLLDAGGAEFGNGEIAIIYFLDETTGLIDSRIEVDYPDNAVGGFDVETSVLPDVGDTTGFIDWRVQVDYPDWDIGGASAATTVLPDMRGFVDALLADAGVAGTSAAVSVVNEGTVTTSGDGAHGILAYTISGTGRAGKDSCTFCSAPSAGGPGADGGMVSVENNGAIATEGDGAAGIVALSRGGTGGEGGYGGPWYYGRTGGAGGQGGTPVVTGTGSITTDGFQASGIVATSEGGIGGNGGDASGGMGGGRGGRGGHAGNVLIDSDMTITTHGDDSHGIWARSIGGGGGTGGSAGWLGTASGGSGGNASDGGIVTITNGGEITTGGLFSYGIFGQSIGGFGGDGGKAAGLFVGWGGTGTSAGSGGRVDILNDETGSITTWGDYSHAIFGQSIGGGGGAGGSGGGIAGIGGAAGAGGYGGPVEIGNFGTIETWGINARGIFAQSIGGGGGDGGYGAGIGAVGGAGAVASDGDTVAIENHGAITTHQRNAEAIFAQSIGGGGGTGGDAGGIGSVGGGGAGGGAGGDIFVTNGGSLDTRGFLSHGIFAQSIGGGGGNGGDSGGLVSIGGDGSSTSPGGNVTVLNEGSIATLHNFATGMFLQSIGGGGGNGGGSGGLVSIGGDGGGGGDGGNLLGDNLGAITTDGDFAQGVFAQSVGGSGGNGRASGGLFFSMGGSGGRAGEGGDITFTNDGAITTSGEASQGVFAQSVGGGGGNGGGSGAWTVSIGGSGGAAGDAGDISLFNTGLVETSGFAAQALFAQSVGGGGGNGAGSGSFIASLGGDGGAAGNGGMITIGNSGSLRTTGESGIGVFAQSVGGGGGNGAGSGAWFASIGGDGGAGGAGGDVNVLNSGLIETFGNYAHSVFAQSIGGGGGNGAASGAVWVAIGGDGGEGDDGGAVTVTNGGELVTHGFGAEGVHAESIGGGGGTGATAGALNIAIGGDGGGGGRGGDIVVTNTGSITTYGDLSHSVYGVSIGGGGGSARSSGAGFFAFGGDGGDGRDGGLVTITNENLLATFGHNSTGIFAQSIGGGGGNGGSATTVGMGPNFSIGVSVGGDGGSGGLGQLVTINNAGSIYTEGVNSHGVFVQSVGGGGGNGGNAFSFSATAPVIPEVPVALNASVAVGGSGGTGGNGGAIDVDHSGDIRTLGFRASGITAQSIGGGGGDGGNATAVTLNVNVDASATVAIGGSGGVGGSGNLVDVNSSGTIMTAGDHANAILAQSVGGGGGAGGDATTMSIDLSFPTSPEDLIPMPGFSFDVSIGGSGGAGGNGGDVLVTSSDAILTEGLFASGVLAQSIGGGGGVGGDARTLQFDISANPTDYIPYISDIGFESTLVFGGRGGAAGNGGAVGVLNSADIETHGAFAYGVVAQSVGGGGGTGGNALTFQVDTTDIPLPDVPVLDDISGLSNLSMVLAGSGGAGGNGGLVALNNSGNIFTQGDFAHGVIAQSVAGGGGLAGIVNDNGATTTDLGEFAQGLLTIISGNAGFFGSVGGAGTANDVLLTNTGSIMTLGDVAHGLFAQSAAGLGQAGNVTLTTSGEIYAEGADAFGVVAQSVGGGGNGNIDIEILDGFVIGGSGNGGGVLIADGSTNSLVNHSVVGSVPGVWGTAFISMGGGDSIRNFGTVIGSVDLGVGANSFENFGWFDTGASLYIGDGNSFVNDGYFAPGGVGTLMTTALTGNYVGTEASSLLFDLQFNHGDDVYDVLNVSGTVLLDGTLALNLLDTDNIMPGTFEHVLVTGGGGITDEGIELVVPESAVVSYDLFAPSNFEQALRYSVDFTPSSLEGNHAVFGDYINRVQMAGGSDELDALIAMLVALPDDDALKAAYDRLSPHAYWSNQATRIFAGLGFDRSMHSCPVKDGDYRFTAEGECAWMYMTERDVTHDGESGVLASSEQAQMVNLGFQLALTRHWHGALSFGYEDSELTIPTFAERDAKQYLFGGIAKGRYGPHKFTVSASVGKGDFDTRRFVLLPTPDVVAYGNQDFDLAAVHGQYSYQFGGENWYLAPLFDLGYTDVSSNDFTETGTGPAELVIYADSYAYLTGRAALKFGGEWIVGNATLIRPFADIGYTRFFDDQTIEVSASLLAAPPGVAPFVQWHALDDGYTDAAAGFEILWPNGIATTLGFNGQYGSTWDAEAWYLKLLKSFE